jgi:hypothetical protein
MLPWDLEDWITDVGADLLDRRILDPQSLTPIEALVYEVWLLDTEARNGGVSQYFCNRGITQWQRCVAKAAGLRSFQPFVEAVENIIQGNPDPYQAFRAGGNDAEDIWFKYQKQVVTELKQAYASAP